MAGWVEKAEECLYSSARNPGIQDLIEVDYW
jgi:hypothetical protein